MRKPSTISTNTSLLSAGVMCSGFRSRCFMKDAGSLCHESISRIITSMWSASSTYTEQPWFILPHKKSMCSLCWSVFLYLPFICLHNHLNKTNNVKLLSCPCSHSNTVFSCPAVSLLSYCLNPLLSSGITDSSWRKEHPLWSVKLLNSHQNCERVKCLDVV